MILRERVANTTGLVAAFVGAGFAAWGTDGAHVLFGKALMSAAILSFSLLTFFEARLSAKLPRDELEGPPSTIRFFLGVVCAVAVGAMAFSTLSNDFIPLRKAITLVSGATIAAALACTLTLSLLKEKRRKVR
ncbi:hypothetical protein LJR219_003781 [Phenylobacterium sp. LjRoot219]|uniref:hypothetical protein n=1 Tax=Phenylobacterium sp. LjRoot219 TaxID=3342283 RepID=UPI003ECF987F